MTITRRHLSRRTLLRGAGTALALPLLDAMVPALTPTVRTAAAPVKRLAIVYSPMGAYMKKWTPPTEGPLELSPILSPLAAFRNRVLVIGGLDMQNADARDGGGVHSRIQPCWLTGQHAKRTEGPDMQVGISMDQVAAREIGGETQLASLELALETNDVLGACDLGYTCAYTSTLSWRGPKTPLPMEHNPRAAFERLFGTSDSTDPRTRAADLQRDRSILDSVLGDMADLKKTVSAPDQAKLDEYVDAVRDVERRIQRAEQQADRELPTVTQPSGIPSEFADYAKLMFDLNTLALQADMTRISTFMMARELSVRTYPEIGVPDQHHALSHHQDQIEKLERQAKVNVFHMELFTHFLRALDSAKDGEGSLLDHTMILYGSGMSNSNVHLPYDVPTVVVGGRLFGITPGRHVRHPKGTPLTNLQLAMLEKMNVRVDRFGDSTGTLSLA
ncbi:MAG: DUF1552 domain-containing protein [Vicinamibacterales bacterium]